jgi:hypothetical protein
MHDIKVNTRIRGEVEHWWGNIDLGADDNGLHRIGSARCFMATSAPTTLYDSVSDADSQTPARTAVTDLNDSASNSSGNADDDVGHGRCWIDTDGPDDSDGNADDNTLYFYTGLAGDDNADGWEAANIILGGAAGGGSIEGDDQILAGSANIVYNGSFEATDGTGLASATAVPVGWAAIDAATFTYGTTTDPDLRWGDGVYVIVTDVDGADGMSIVLNNLAANTTFKVLARVAEEDASDICTLTSTGADTDVTSTASAGVAWQTLSGTFITGAALDDVTLTFTNTAAGDICNWDHVAVYQVGDTTTDRDEIAVPTMSHVTDSVVLASAVPGTFTDVTGLTVALMPPQPNCLVQVDAVINVNTAAGGSDNAFTTCRLQEDGVTKDSRIIWVDVDAGTTMDDFAGYLALDYTSANPTPGTQLDYTVQCDQDAGNAVMDYNCDNHTCDLSATMFCGGH